LNSILANKWSVKNMKASELNANNPSEENPKIGSKSP